MILSNENIFLLVKRLVRKESRGGVFTPDDFNRLFPVLVRERYDNKKKRMEETSDITEDMERYMESVTLNDGSGDYAKPANFEKHLGAMTVYGGVYRPVDNITKLEYTQQTSLTKPTVRDPVIYYEGGRVFVRPTTSSVELHYMVSPAVPFLDYYIDANKNIVYLSEDQEVEVGSGMVFRDNYAGLTYTSETVECDMSDSDKVAVMYSMLKSCGVSLPDDVLFQYGMNEQVKSEL